MDAVLFRGRYRTRREVFEWIARQKAWRGAVETETDTHWVLTLGAAEIKIWKT